MNRKLRDHSAPELDGVEYPWAVPDVAKAIGYGERYVRELVRKGKIPCIKYGRDYRFNPDQVKQAQKAMIKVGAAPKNDLDTLLHGV